MQGHSSVSCDDCGDRIPRGLAKTITGEDVPDTVPYCPNCRPETF